MSDLVVITFPDETSGPAALQAMRDAQKNAGLALKDVAAVTKDADGKVHKHNETDSTTLTGIVGGGFLGLLLGLVFFPIGGLAIGAIAGGLIGHSLGHNVDKNLVTGRDQRPRPWHLRGVRAGRGPCLRAGGQRPSPWRQGLPDDARPRPRAAAQRVVAEPGLTPRPTATSSVALPDSLRP